MDRPGYGGVLKLVGLLLALNVGVFVAGMALQYGTPTAPEQALFNADKVHLLASQTPFEREVVSPAQPAPAEIQTDPATPPDSPLTEVNRRCLSWSQLAPDDLLSIESYLAQIGITFSAYRIELDKPLGWWVFLPPFKDKAALDVKIEEVRRLGISDMAPVRGGSMRNALSLGAFAALEQAREHAASLARKGVMGVRYGPRPESGTARLIIADSIAEYVLPSPDSAWPQGLKPMRCVLPE